MKQQTKVQVVDDTYISTSKANQITFPQYPQTPHLCPTLIIFYSFKIILITSMNVLLGILQESINIISGTSNESLQKFYSNKTLDERIKAIIKRMQSLKDIKDADSQLIFQLREFKDNLTIGHAESIDKIIESKGTPERFRDSLKEINELFNETNRQLSLNLECSYFYKQMLKRIIEEKDLTEEEINNQEDISEDKRNAIISLLRKITKMKDEIKELKHRAEEVEALHKDNRVQVKEMEEELVKLLKEKEDLKENLKNKDGEIQKLKKAKEASQKEIKLKNEELKTLNKNIQNQKKELEAQKSEIAKQRKEIHIQRSEIVKQSQIKGKDLQGKIKQLQDKIKKQEKKSKESQKKQQEKNDQMQKEFDQKQKQIEDLRKEIESFNAEKEKLLQSSVKIGLDNRIAERINMIVESAEFLTKNISQSSYSKLSSIMSSQFAKVYPSMNQAQAKTYFKDKYFTHDATLNSFFKELKNPTRFDVIYQYPQDKHTIFGDILKGKRNLLLICKAQAGSVVGGYTEIGFAKAKAKDTSKCFIFTSKAEHSTFLRAKKGKIGVTEDSDFLIFGCEQLSLERNCSYATCQYLNYQSNNLQFQGSPQQRQKFQEIAGTHPPNHKIPLQYYQILQLNFSK